jgi:uncharacterized protein (DUF58 family)
MARQMDLTEQFRPVLAWLSRHFNAQRFFIFFSLILFLVAWNRGIALLYGMVSLLVAILAVSYLLPHRNIRKLKVQLPTQLRGTTGEMLGIELALSSKTRCEHISVSLEGLFPADERNQAAFTPYLHGQASANLKWMCNQRGDYEIGQLVVSSDFPFGLHTAKRRINCTPGRLLVYPKTFCIHELPMFSSRSHAIHSQKIFNLPHSDEEYAGVREYRQGDNLKHIHWGASARHQALIVREFESYDRPAMLIILNCNEHDEIGQAPHSSLEYSIQIAASLMLFASRRGIAVELFAEGRQGFHLSMSPGETLMECQLGQFAQMKADGSCDYSQLVASASHRFHHIDTVVTFFPQQISDLRCLGNKNHIDIRFDQPSFIDRRFSNKRIKPAISGTRVSYTVHWGDPLERVFNEGH